MKLSDMKYGVRSYFSALARGHIVLPGHMPRDLEETIHLKVIASDIEKTNNACISVKDLMVQHYPEPMKTFFDESGKRYAMTKNNNECKRFLTDYLYWMDSKIEKPIDFSDIKLPDMKLPTMPKLPLSSVGSDIKESLQVTGMVVMLFVVLIVYLMFVKGGAGREVKVG